MSKLLKAQYITTVSRPVEIGLRVMGVWPSLKHAILYQNLWALGIGIVQVFQYWYVISHATKDEFPDLMEGLSVAMSYSVILFKLSCFWFNRKLICEILEMMIIDWKESIGRQTSIMARKAELSEFYSKWIIILYMISSLFYALLSTISQLNYDKTNPEFLIDEKRPLLLKMEFPLGGNSSSIYHIILVTQYLNYFPTVAVGSIMNVFLLTLVLHIAGQIDIVKYSLIQSMDKDRNILALSLIVNRHQKIIKFSMKIESLFTYIALIQFLSTTMIICCIGLVIVTSLRSTEVSIILVKLVGYYFCTTLEAFILCFAGEYLSEQSKSISDAAYESQWYQRNQEECRILLFLMHRSQKQLSLTIGKFMVLSLRRFGSILKASASYMSVLYALY